jgi:hypothetical protein
MKAKVKIEGEKAKVLEVLTDNEAIEAALANHDAIMVMPGFYQFKPHRGGRFITVETKSFVAACRAIMETK